MKRYFSIALIALALAIAIPASAQDKKASLQFDKPTAISDIIKAVTEEEGLKVTGVEALTNDMTFKGELELRPVTSVVSRLVKPFGFETVLDDASIYIRRVSGTTTQAVASNSAATLTPEPTLNPGPPTIHNDAATIEEMVQRKMFGDRLYEQMQAEKTAAKQVALVQPTAPVQTATVSDPALIEQQVQMKMFGPGGYEQVLAQNAMSPGYMGGGYGFYNPFMYRDFSNQEKYGLLKIDGPDRFLHNVRVVIDGFDATVASKSNNRWNDPVVLTVGNHVIEFVRESKEGITAFRRNVSVVPMSVSRKPFWLRVTGNEFDHGREIYVYRQHRYVEQVDGTVR